MIMKWVGDLNHGTKFGGLLHLDLIEDEAFAEKTLRILQKALKSINGKPSCF